MVRPRGTVIQVRSFGRSGVADVLCKFGDIEAPGACRTGRKGGVGAGHENKKVSPRAMARRPSAVMRTQAVARPNGKKRQRESHNRAPQDRGIEERKASKLLAAYQLLGDGTCRAARGTPARKSQIRPSRRGKQRARAIPRSPITSILRSARLCGGYPTVPRHKLAPARPTAKGAIGAGLGNSKERQCTVGGGYGRMNGRRS